ncbi:flagellar filament capping protein FliD [Cupriavidus sp. AU9028]|uniref:flagellar filament capping protein FliD n=1 Tax=Cupriavidus sp. AU9028 TaxID=2871157 RepID=UPI001C97EECF|nr:flagellar filament capping protein FliD [Cupriavidus sp. AU9028]MBY4898497.1 flagellar filament capping protein FliD [Cupriavidus sp. AU9028]
MAVSAIGLGSNLPLADLLDDLEAAERGKLKMIESRQDLAEARISAFGKFKGALEAYQTAAKKLLSNDTWGAAKTSLGTSGVIGVQATSKAVNGDYSITVNRLAQAQSVATKGIAKQDVAIGTGTIKFEFGTVTGYDETSGTYVDPAYTANADKTKTITISEGNNTLQGIRDEINKANIGVTASIVNDGSGTPYRLVLRSNETGEASTMRITGSSPALQGVVGYDPEATTQPSGATETVRATNASLTINGMAVTSPSNTMKEAIQGVTLTAVSVGTSTLKVTRDTDTMTTAVEGFVKAYNSLQSTISELTAFNADEGTNAALTGDGTVRNIQVQMRSVLNTTMGSDPAFRMLSDVGIEFELDGTLSLDKEALTEAIGENLGGVQKLFAGDGTTGGFARAVSDKVTELNRTQGTLTLALEGADRQLEDLEDQYEIEEARVEATIARYRAQFTALDALVAQMNSTSSYLSQQFEAMSNSGK